MKQVIDLILEAIMFLLLLMSGVSIDLPNDAFVMHEYETYDCTMYDECMNNSYNRNIVPTTVYEKCMKMYDSANHTVMNMYETPNQYSMDVYENVHTPKNYIVDLNTSINRSERVDGWSCYDYSVDFAENNHEWGVVTIGRTKNFCPKSHMVNYLMYEKCTKVYETQPDGMCDKCMIVYDGLLDNLYYINGWQYDYDYYHFWIDGSQPVRNYRFLVDNRDVVM